MALRVVAQRLTVVVLSEVSGARLAAQDRSRATRQKRGTLHPIHRPTSCPSCYCGACRITATGEVYSVLSRMHCRDQPGWHNGHRSGGALDCEAYAQLGYCQHGNIIQLWASGAAFNHPERACCVCGRQLWLQRKHAGGYGLNDCQCRLTSLCTAHEVAAFMLRAPGTVNRRSSPWFAYAKAVYRGDPPLPFSLRSFELFYPGLLPVMPCVAPDAAAAAKERHPPQATSSWCSEAHCAGWFPNPVPTEAVVEAFVANRSFVRLPARYEGDRRAFGHAVVLQRRVEQRSPVGRFRWVEVTRHADAAEGTNDCNQTQRP